MSGKTKARGLGGGVMTGITSAARSAEIRRRMMEEDSDSDLDDSPPAKKRVVKPWEMDSDDEEDKPKDVVRANEDMVGGVDDDNKKMGSGGMDVESPQTGGLSDLKKATVDSTVPLRLFDFSQPKLENVDAWASATVYDPLERSVPPFLFDILSKGKREYFSAMEHKVIPAYVKGRLAPTLGKSREDSEQLTKILLALSFLVYFSADDDVAVMAFRAFCDVDDLVDEIHDSEVDLRSNLAALFQFYGTTSTDPALPSLVPPAQDQKGKGSQGAILSKSELFVSEGDIYPASDSVMRFTQALRVFLRMSKRQIKAHPKKWCLSRSSVCVDLLLALSQVLPCCDGGGDGDGGGVLAGQGRHSDAVTALEDVVTLYVEPQSAEPLNLARDLCERAPQQFHRTARALAALRNQRPLFRASLRQAFSLDEPKEAGFRMFKGVEWVAETEDGSGASDKEAAVNFKSLMGRVQAELGNGVSSVEVSAIETLFYLAHSFFLTGTGLDQKDIRTAFKEAVHACALAHDSFQYADESLKKRAEFIACSRTCAELTEQIRSGWDDVETKTTSTSLL